MRRGLPVYAAGSHLGSFARNRSSYGQPHARRTVGVGGLEPARVERATQHRQQPRQLVLLEAHHHADYPKQHAVLGQLVPSPDTVAKAIAARDATRFQPAGAYAANLLGLSEQVPATVLFLTDGLTRTIHVGAMTISLRRTTPRNMATAGRLSGLLIQALRYQGKQSVTPTVIQQLRRTLAAGERHGLLRDIKLAPAWMHPVFRALAAVDAGEQGAV